MSAALVYLPVVRDCSECRDGYFVVRRTGKKATRCMSCRKRRKTLDDNYRMRAQYAAGNSWITRNPEKVKRIRKAYNAANAAMNMWRRARLRAQEKHIPFDIEVADIEIPTHCPILGVAMQSAIDGPMQADYCPTLDRIIPALGYVKGNVVVVSWRANRMKSNSTPGELRKIVDWLEARGL